MIGVARSWEIKTRQHIERTRVLMPFGKGFSLFGKMGMDMGIIPTIPLMGIFCEFPGSVARGNCA